MMMKTIDLNKKFKFISDGTWFLEGSECIVEDGHCLWRSDGDLPTDAWDYEYLLAHQDRISGLFRGPIYGNPDDGELCGLDEFTVIKRTEE
jgi:hypothetical protein